MKKNPLYIAVFASLLSGSLYAGAMGPVDEIKSLYLRADLGYNVFNTPSAITASFLSNTQINAIHTDIDNIVGYNIGIGYQFTPQLRSDITFTYRPSIAFQVIDDAPEIGTATLRNYTVMVNGYFDMNLNLPVTPYVMGGIGVSSNATGNIYWPLVQQNESGKSGSHFAWQVGAGMAYALNNNLLIDLNYQLVELGKFSNTGQYDTRGPFNIGLTGTPTSFDTLYSNQVQLGVRYYL